MQERPTDDPNSSFIHGERLNSTRASKRHQGEINNKCGS